MNLRKARLCASLMRGNFLKYICAILAVAVSAAAGFATPLVLAGAIDALTAAASGRWDAAVNLPRALAVFFENRGGVRFLVGHLWMLAALLLLLYLLSSAAQYLRGRWAAQASESFAQKLRNRLYAHIQSLPYDYHVNAQTGDLIQRCISDVETIRRFLATQGVEAFRAAVMLAIGVPILLSIDALATLWSVVLFVPMFLFAVWFFRWIKRYFAISDAAEGRMSAVLQESLTGVRVVRAFGRQSFEEEKFNASLDDLYKKSLKLYHVMNAFWSVSDGIGTAQIGIAVLAAVILAVRGGGNLSAGGVTVFAGYVSMLIWPIRQLGRILSDLGKSLVSLERLDEILRQEPERETEGAVVAPVDRDISFEGVRFGYREGPEILKGVTFDAKAGETVAILGATGSGKSTLMLLLQRHYAPTSGAIRIGGVDIQNIRKDHLRARVGLVMQESFLYARSVGDNIRIVRPDAPDEAVFKAARTARVDDFARDFERGYDTLVGERGVTLSGGQKQRVSIARALLKENDVLIFDDSLSAVDSATDRAIREALRQRRAEGEKSATTFVISHRLTTLSEADKIVVLQGGTVAEIGTHDELIRTDGLYRRIYQIQSALESELSEGGESP
ncbi:MAG: ABC transporter ATP-binding protein [Clostridiales bacterium]|nr:ABC transporter ATP-binding protein [Clostridiales bacterium]